MKNFLITVLVLLLITRVENRKPSKLIPLKNKLDQVFRCSKLSTVDAG